MMQNILRRFRVLSGPRGLTALTLLLNPACGSHKASGSAFSGTCLLPASAAAAPATLAATGCFGSAGEAASNLHAYTVNTTSWSSGASKARWLVLPMGGHAVVDANGAFTLPANSGVWKDFLVDGVRVETRLLLKDAGGTFSGLSYVWNDGQDAASLSADGGLVQVAGKAWQVPSRSDCLFCHNGVGGPLLGLRAEQLDVPAGAPAGAVSQIDSWAAAGVVVADGNHPRPTPWPNPLGSAPLATRARSYLAANCSFCHQTGAPSGTHTNYLFATPLSEMGICGVAATRGNLGVAGGLLLDPGASARSVLSARVHSADPDTQMPPVGRTAVDTAGAAVIDAWIDGLAGCEDP